MNHLGRARRPRRAVAAMLGLALLSFHPALALADEPAPPSDSESAPPRTDIPRPTGGVVAPVEEPPNRWVDGLTKTFDVIPIRLLSACAVAIGFGAFVASVPLVGPGFQLEGIRNSWDYFVVAPAEYTFVRPLGDF